MIALDKISEISGYALINAEDGSIEETKDSSKVPIGNLTAFFSSAGEVIKNSLAMGDINRLSLWYGPHRLVIFPYESKYIGIEINKDTEPNTIIERAKSSKITFEKPKIELPRSVITKVQQINLFISEFGGKINKAHWVDILNQGLGILGGEIVPFVGIINDELAFRTPPPREKEADFDHALRAIMDFLVKKAVEKMGPAQARAKVQAAIERMK